MCKASVCSVICKRAYESSSSCATPPPRAARRSTRKEAARTLVTCTPRPTPGFSAPRPLPGLTPPPGLASDSVVPHATSQHDVDADGQADLATAVSLPALDTAEKIPGGCGGGLHARITRIFVDCLAFSNAAQLRAWRHPGVNSKSQAVEASRWLWLLPVLLLRRAKPLPGLQPPSDAPFSFSRCVKRRVQMAETAQWAALLREYVAQAAELADDTSFGMRPIRPHQLRCA